MEGEERSTVAGRTDRLERVNGRLEWRVGWCEGKGDYGEKVRSEQRGGYTGSPGCGGEEGQDDKVTENQIRKVR